MKPASDKRRTSDLPRRILFLNDVGFQYGAGVAQARQVEAILALGIEVGVLAWATGEIKLEDVGTRPIDRDLWLGLHEVNDLEGGKTMSDDTVIAGLLMEVARFNPEIVLVGNLHAAHWPLSLLPALRGIGCRVITFLHDAYLYTGRCAYPGSCQLYLTGCNETCPTADQYPKLEPALIAGAWQIRRDIFGGPHGIEVVANSHWNRRMMQIALPACSHVATIHLGADEFVYQPGDKRTARLKLGLPLDKPIVLCAAVNFQEPRKGCHQLREIITALQDSVTFAAFGHNAHEIPGLIGLGFHLNATKLAVIYQAADLFLGTATEEAFGQTLMEAQLCGLPVVAFHTGGVDEIVRNEITGRLVRNGDAGEAITTISRILADVRFMETASSWARQYAVSRFSQKAHAERWQDFLSGRTQHGTGHHPPNLTYPLQEPEDCQAMDRHRPSWSGAKDLLSEEHARIFEQTASLPGWQMPGDSFKLFEMGYHAGDVILEIGPLGGRSASVMLRGALANRSRTLRPQYFGVAMDSDSIARTRDTLTSEMIGELCHLFRGLLPDFMARWNITPTMVFLDGNHTYAEFAADLRLLSRYLKPGTPVLVHDFLNRKNETDSLRVRKVTEEWTDAGHGRFMGCFGCSALFITLDARH